ncbi:MAG TPA: FAD-binding protein [Chlamydiales bacterium]|nr:FAD-binding protein [Chlamydiales bacterium]
MNAITVPLISRSNQAQQKSQQDPTFFSKVSCAAFFIFNTIWSVSEMAIQMPASRIYNKNLSVAHHEHCLKIQKEFKAKLSQEDQIVLKPKATTFLYRPRVLSSTHLDLRGLNQVVHIDEQAKTAHVQGLTTFYDLLDSTLQKGLRPKVTPELRGITIGGAISGLAVESSSFKHGLFSSFST